MIKYYLYGCSELPAIDKGWGLYTAYVGQVEGADDYFTGEVQDCRYVLVFKRELTDDEINDNDFSFIGRLEDLL